MVNYSVILCTTNTQESAKTIAKTLVKEKLCACTNIIPSITSIYSWKDNLEEDSEVLMIIKSKTELFDKIEKRIKELHPYEVPEIISIDISKGSKAYLDWIDKNTI